MVFQHVSDAFLLLLHHNFRFVLLVYGQRFLLLLLLFENGRRIAGIALILCIFHGNAGIPHLFAFGVGGLDSRVPYLLALAFVEFAGSVDVPDDFGVDLDPFLRIELLLVEHGDMEHAVLDPYTRF